MAGEQREEARAPSFAAPRDAASYLWRIVHGPRQMTEAITPQRDLFVPTHLRVPRVDAAEWRLDIADLVERLRC